MAGSQICPRQHSCRALRGIMNRVEDGYLFDVCNNKLINLNQFEIKDFGNTDQIYHYSHVQALKRNE